MMRSLIFLFLRAAMTCLILTGIFYSTATAQNEDAERDPFYPAEQRPAAPVPRPVEDDWGRDPFSNPLARTAPALSNQSQTATHRGLTGIIYNRRVRLAIIDGEVLHEGSAVGDKKVMEIRRKSVLLVSAAGGVEELRLSDFSVEK